MIKPLTRCRSSSLAKRIHLNTKAKVFARHTQNEEDEDERVNYEEGVYEITNIRRTLSLSKDTTFLAIDMFKGCLNKKLVKNSKNIQELYIACIYIAAKVNQVLTLKVEEAIEGCDSFAKKQDIFRMESRILNCYEYELPYDQNLVKITSEYLGEIPEKQTIMNRCLKTLLDSISDPYFMNVDNKTFIAALYIHCPDHVKKLKLANKAVIPIVGKLKKMEKERKASKENLFPQRTFW